MLKYEYYQSDVEIPREVWRYFFALDEIFFNIVKKFASGGKEKGG